MLIKSVLVAAALLGIAGLFATPKPTPAPNATHQVAVSASGDCCDWPPPNEPGCPPQCPLKK